MVTMLALGLSGLGESSDGGGNGVAFCLQMVAGGGRAPVSR